MVKVLALKVFGRLVRSEERGTDYARFRAETSRIRQTGRTASRSVRRELVQADSLVTLLSGHLSVHTLGQGIYPVPQKGERIADQA